MPDEGISRREFLTVSGGVGIGLVVSFTLPARGNAATPPAAGEFSAWIRIGSDDSVYFSVSKMEMGQGVFTAIPMLLAEELEVPWEQVRAEQAPADARFGQRQQTGGSNSIRNGYEGFRRAGAAARSMLVAEAAERWGVPAAECRAEQGVVTHAASAKRARYGELAAGAASRTPPENPPLKERSEFRLIGRRIHRLDTPAKTDGSAQYGLDVRVPGMKVALVERPPTLGARVQSFSDKRAKQVAGVEHVVEIDSGVAVVARSTWPAMRGREQLEVSWTPGERGISDESIAKSCREALSNTQVARDDGDVDATLERAPTKHTASYSFPYLAHAAMEPMNCTAHVREDACEVWVPTQSQSAVRNAAAELTGLPPERVTVHPTFMGGGFGRRSETDYVEDAVQLSQRVGGPVQVVYSREDDMRAGYYRPTGYNELAGALDAEGKIVAWDHRLAVPSIMRDKGWAKPGQLDRIVLEGARDLPYAIPNLRVAWADVRLPIGTHWWRSVGSSHNAWVTECFFDELCRAGGLDPVEARLSLLGEHPRHHRALRVAAEKAGWGASLPEGHALGVSVHESFASYVAQVAEVSVGKRGRPKVHRVVCAIDCGEVVNPDTVEAQMEGAIAFGLSAALHGRVSFKEGRVLTTNFDRYPLLRIPDMPRVETHIIAEGDPMGGAGEPGTPPIAPAVCNALHALTGKPVRELPIASLS